MPADDERLVAPGRTNHNRIKVTNEIAAPPEAALAGIRSPVAQSTMVVSWPEWDRLVEHVVTTSVHLRPEESRAIFAAAAGESAGNLPADLGAFVGRAAEHTYRLTDEQLAETRRSRSEDEIFEAAVLVAMGVAHGRYRSARRAMEAATDAD